MGETHWIRDGQLDPETAIPALRSFLDQLLAATGLELRAEVRSADCEGELENIQVAVELGGRDAELVLERRAELLFALEHIA
ncbi:MAG: hypothetical protein ACE5IP_09730, partial [Terriglobia bacterium]